MSKRILYVCIYVHLHIYLFISWIDHIKEFDEKAWNNWKEILDKNSQRFWNDIKDKFISIEFQSAIKIIEKIMGNYTSTFKYLGAEKFSLYITLFGQTKSKVSEKKLKSHLFLARAKQYDDPSEYKVRIYITICHCSANYNFIPIFI